MLKLIITILYSEEKININSYNNNNDNKLYISNREINNNYS